MLNAAAKPFVKLVERYLPDPYIFVLLLSIVVFTAAVLLQQHSPLQVLQYWGDGFWGLLSFSMQMLLVLVTGFMLASTPLVTGLLNRLAGLAKTAGQAIVLVTSVMKKIQCFIIAKLQSLTRYSSLYYELLSIFVFTIIQVNLLLIDEKRKSCNW